MDLELKGKIALVTGSTAGIGLAIATTLAREGASVIVNGRTQARVDAAVKKVREHGGPDVAGIAADVGNAEGAAKLAQALAAVDILVNNMGIFEPKAFADIPDSDWFRFFEANVMSGVRLSRAYLPKMVAKNWGRIIFISSESGLQTPAEMIHYGVTKTAQLAVSRGLAESVAGTGITINSVLPGPTRSEGVEGFVKDMARTRGTDTATIEADFFRNVRPSSLIKRFSTSEEIASMVAFLCSPLASSTTGAAVRVDGGVVRTIA